MKILATKNNFIEFFRRIYSRSYLNYNSINTDGNEFENNQENHNNQHESMIIVIDIYRLSREC